jgi:nicotinamide-nucleotide amidase
MRAAILSIGSELLRGDIVDTNAAFLAAQLTGLGFDVRRIEQIGDDLDELTVAVKGSLQIADVLLCTGGLGPTQDDLTREAIAGALEEELYFDDALVGAIEARFAAWRRRMPIRNRRQGMLIASARSLPNPNGTAPGWQVEKNDKIIVAMPGPPGEMIPMWHATVKPRLAGLLPNTYASRAVMTFGLGESMVEEKISDLLQWRPDVTVATYAKPSGVEVHVTARGSTADAASALATEAEQMIRSRLGTAVYGHGSDTLSAVLGRYLVENELTIAVMESCTGGALCNMITDEAGSSDYFQGGVVAYSSKAKIAHGVDECTISEYGMYSKQTGLAMAVAARRHFGADIGLGITGIAGRQPIEGKAPGTCYVAVSLDDREEVREIIRPGDRESVKRFAALSALDLLRRELRVAEGMPV